MKFLSVIIVLCVCSACTTTNVEKIERIRLDLDYPQPLSLADLEWNVYVKDNQAYICLDNQGYTNLSKNMQELKRFIIQQREIIKAYKEYYEPNQDSVKSN